MAVDDVDRALAVVGKDSKLTILHVEDAIAITEVLVIQARMAEVAVPGVPPVIGVLAILVARPHVVRDGTAPKELPHLRKDGLGHINFRRRRIGMLDPLVLVPHGIGTVLGENGDDRLPRFVTRALMERPVLPERSEDLPARDGVKLRFALNLQFLPERHLRRTHLKRLSDNGADLSLW